MTKPRSTRRIDRYGNEILEGERIEISNGMAYENEDDYPIAIVKYDEEKELFKVEFKDGSYAELNDICHNDMVLV